jgi:ABC-2 type transport system permease protein
MYYLRLIKSFMQVSIQAELAYRANFFISLLHSLLNLGTGVLGLVVLFSQVSAIHGWDFSATLALLGAYLVLGALRDMFIGPSLDALAGLDGEVWTGRLDFTLLRPVNAQFVASFHQWRLLPVVDLLLGAGIVGVAISRTGQALTSWHMITFLVALCVSLVVLYALLLAFSGLVFWSAGFLFTWVFDGLFQLARYPVGLYPGWTRFLLTWIIPVGIMTTIPAQALNGNLSITTLLGAVILALVLLTGATAIFQTGLRRYTSASS